MIIRLWVTGLKPDCTAAYDAFAHSHSFAMFKSLDGCEGVLFVRSDQRGYVFSFWRDHASIEALSSSAVYAATVKEIVAAGFLDEPQTVDLVEMTGGFLSVKGIRFLLGSGMSRLSLPLAD